MDQTPKYILRIEDLTFILPDDFKGNFVDALENLLEYSRNNIEQKKYVENNKSTIENALSEESRLCMNYGLFKKENGSYKRTEKI